MAGTLQKQNLPDYTRGEEIFNMVTHIVGGALCFPIILMCAIKGALNHDGWAVTTGIIYGCCVLLMFTVSAIYHGLRPSTAKKVMRIIDHCDIYVCIAGTYTPVLLVSIRPDYPRIAWIIFVVEWVLAFIGILLNAIDIKKFSKFSFLIYLGMGWGAVLILGKIIEALTIPGFIWMLLGGVAFSIGAVLYLLGHKKRYIHSVFHIFVVLGVLLQFISIYIYVI